MRADLIDAEPDCECGMDHTASVREEIVIQLLYEEHEAHHHPGRYRHPPKGRRNTLLASLQRFAMILTHATSLFGLLHPMASTVSQGGPAEQALSISAT